MPVRARNLARSCTKSTTTSRFRAAATACALAAITGLTPMAGSAQGASVPEPRTPAQQVDRPADCPNATAPPPPIDTSEVPKPGQTSPDPLPVPETPAGGPRLAECGLIAPAHVPAPPTQVKAGNWLLADLDSGDILSAQDPHARQRPASCIKVLTALVAINELKMDDTITATQQDADQEGSKVGLAPGATYTVRQVLTGLIMESGNDAAHALAGRVGGDEAMVTKMNDLAHRLGANDTRTATPSGLDGPGMSTSAYDLALIFRAAMRHPEFAQAAATKDIEIPGPPGQPPLQVETDDAILMTYPGAIGAKSGFTDDARHTFIGAAQRDGRKLVAVLMHGENQPIRQSTQTMRLLDHGFGLGKVEPVGRLVQPRPATKAVAPAPPPQKDTENASSEANTSVFGTVGAPLALLVVAGGVLVAVLMIRRRRAKFAAAKRDNAELPDDHP